MTETTTTADEVETTEVPAPTVDDVETAKAVFVTRALYIGGYGGHHRNARSALRHIGLEDYYDSGIRAFDIQLGRLKGMLGDTVTIHLANGTTPPYATTLVRDTVRVIVGEWARELADEEWAQQEGPSKLVNTAEVGSTFGNTAPLPATNNPEVTETWRQLTLGVLKWADETRLCETVEHMLRQIGMGEFIPSRRVNLSVQWCGQTIELTDVVADRLGKVSQSEVIYRLQRLLETEVPTVVDTTLVPALA